MITTTKDIFYLAISGGFVILVIFLCALITNLILITRDINKVTDQIRDIVDKIDEYIMKPIKVVNRLAENIGPIMDFVERKIDQHKKRKK